MGIAAANKVLGTILLFVIFLISTTAIRLCDIETKELGVCRPAVTPVPGQPLPAPTEGCCSVVRQADLKCLCSHKSELPAMGINTANALALLPKCGLQMPSECYA